MKATDALWMSVLADVRRTVWVYSRQVDCTEGMSLAGEVFVEACQTYDASRMEFKEWFLMKLGNRLRRIRRRNAVRHRLLPRVPFTDPFQPMKPFRLDDFLDSLGEDGRQLVEEVVGYDQSLILRPANRPEAWPVKGIMVSVRNRLRRKGWKDDRINRAIAWAKRVWRESA